MSDDPIKKTNGLGMVQLPIDVLEANEYNPNEMSDKMFNLLYDNISKMGITEPILVRKLQDDKYRIVGGHHRWTVAKLLGFETVPCVVIDDPDFTDDEEKFQVTRMNIIKGRMSPAKFAKLYQSLSPELQNEAAAEMFGFADEEEFQKMIKQSKAALSPDMQVAFDEALAKKEIKTIDDLSKLLNSLFSKYGSTIPFGYLLMDYGGKESVWLRAETKERKKILTLGHRCIDASVTLDSLVHLLFDYVLDPKNKHVLDALLKFAKPAEIPEGYGDLPTEENLKDLGNE